MKRIISIVLVLVLLVFSLASCGTSGKNDSSTTMKPLQTTSAKLPRNDATIGLLAGPTGVGAAKMLDESVKGVSANNYKSTIYSAADQVTAKIVSGELNIAAVPTNLAAVLYQKTKGKVQIAAINTLGVLYLMTADGTTIKSVDELKGKTIYSSGKGAVPEYVLNYILDAYGIEDSVKVIYESEHDTVITDLASGKAKIAILPEPKVTAALSSVKGSSIALNLTTEWDNAAKKKNDTNSTLAMGCIVVNKDYAEANKLAFNAFLNEYKASIEYMSNSANIENAAKLCETYKIIPKAAVAKKAIPNCNLTYIDGADMKAKMTSFLKVLYGYNAASVGGKLPDDSFYYSK